MTKQCFSALACFLLLGVAEAQERGVINDPDGFTNLRAKPSGEAAVVAKVKAGEVFEFNGSSENPWWEVTLASGRSGWMHHSRIRMHVVLDDIPEKDEEGSEVAYYGKGHGFDYCATARGAARGDPKALKRFFGINDMDGGAAETHASVFWQVVHLLGDERLAAFLKVQPLQYQLDVRNDMFSGSTLWPLEDSTYAERNFPRTRDVLCRREITGWHSPDGHLGIRKVFSDSQVSADSKVVKAELKELSSGKVIADLTRDDTATGPLREGKVLWAPDSKRFAYFSSLSRGSQTVVYQQNDSGFRRMEAPEVALPGRTGDTELKGAKHLWTIVEPQRWDKPDTLILLRHEYFEKLREDRSIHSMGRTYDVAWDLTTGSITAKVRRHGD